MVAELVFQKIIVWNKYKKFETAEKFATGWEQSLFLNFPLKLLALFQN